MKAKLKAKWIIKFGVGSKVLVKVGDKVKQGQVVVKVNNRRAESMDLSNFFGKFNKDKILQINEKLKGAWVNSGELICLSGGIFPKKVCFPMSGNFLGIDELGYLKIEVVDSEQREILAPVDSSVYKIEKDKVILEFRAREYKGKGIVLGKCWGEGIIKVINEAKDLNSQLNKSILFTQNLSNSFLLKAEVVGVVGVVTCSEIEGELATTLPLLKFDETTWSELIKYKDTKKKMLINSRLERLLLVLE